MLSLLSVTLTAGAAVIVLLTGLVYLAPARVLALALGLSRRHAGLVRREVTLAGGLRVVYLEGGQGEPLLLLHGFGANKDTFTPVARYLTRHYRVIVPDIIGFAESAHPQDVDYSPGAQLERLREFAGVLRLEGLHLGGNSMGGQLALLHAARYPQEVKSLWLLSPAGIWSAPRSEVGEEFAATGRNRLLARTVEEFKAVMALGMLKPPKVPAPMLKVLARERIDNVELEMRIFQHIMDCSLEALIEGLRTPALIVFGRQDRVIRTETAMILRSLLPAAEVVLMDRTGHVPMFERPRQCAQDYLRFRQSAAQTC